MGLPSDSARGLNHYMGVSDDSMREKQIQGVDAIRQEVLNMGTAEDKKWFDYVYTQPAVEKSTTHGVRDQGRRGERLADFVNHPDAKLANLSEAHILAIRLYTTPIFNSLNAPLRSGCQTQPHPFAATIAFLSEAIRRLRTVDAEGESANDAVVLWRGMRDLSVSEEFMARGGTEVAPMSTTPNLAVALSYGVSSNTLLFRLNTASFMERGASLAFCSVFPAEDEYLYPPLTYLRPTGVTEAFVIDGRSFTVVCVDPCFGS